MMFYKKKKFSLTESNAYVACLRKLNYRNHSYRELEVFLSQSELTTEFIHNLLADLVSVGYLDDHRFAQSLYVSWEESSYKGKLHLLHKLKKHLLPEDIIAEYADQDLGAIEIVKATNLIKRYITQKKYGTEVERIKISNYLRSQCHTPQTIRKVILEYEKSKIN